MLTRCPHCTTTFRVKPEQLKVRLGRVRCGECRTVFNALDSLVEETAPTPAMSDTAEVSTLPFFTPQTEQIPPSHDAASAAEQEPADGRTDNAPEVATIAEAEVPAVAEADEATPAAQETSIELEIEPELEPEAPPVAPVAEDPIAAAEPEAEPELQPKPAATATEPSLPAEQEPIVEPVPAADPPPRDDDGLVPADGEPYAASLHAPQTEAESAPLVETAEDLDFTPTAAIAESAVPEGIAAVAAEPASQENAAPPFALATTAEALPSVAAIAEHEPLLHRAPRPSRRWPWAVLAVLTSLLLAGQALFYYRVEVAVAAPALKPVLKAACEAMGCEVPRPRKSEMLDIESSDLHPGRQKGRLELVAVLKNKAPFAQEWPVLEVSLTDVADRALIVKALQPADYLPAGRKPTAGFPAKAEINVNLTLDAGDTPASGYRLYLYYP